MPSTTKVVKFNKCDLEYRAYVYIKCDHFVKLWSFITLCLNIICQWKFITGATNNGLLNAIYRTWIAYTDGEIIGKMWRGVLCAHKP